MWTTRAIELWALGFFFALSASAGSVEIDCSYPGGNVKVVRVDEAKGVVDFAPDLRDTTEDWFWFNFRVRGAEGRTLTFVGAPGYPRLGPLGPAVSTDGGETWRWLRTEPSAEEHSFDYAFAPTDKEARFAFAMPYLQKNWEAFLMRIGPRDGLREGVLLTTARGRKAELLTLEPEGGATPRFLMVFTARHHACEASANPVMEGLVEELVSGSEAARFVRRNARCLFVPFVDKDGVEDGDQGKGRNGADHNRDYRRERYPETRALKALVQDASRGLRIIHNDLHSPWARGKEHDHFYSLGPRDVKAAARWELFRTVFAEEQAKGRLRYEPKWDIPSGIGYNQDKSYNLESGNLNATRWFGDLPNAWCSFCFEFGYGLCGGVYSPEGAREIGRSIVRAWARTIALADRTDFDVRGFGARGDGETKDTASLQRAIDAAGAAGGGRVVLRDGRFLTGSLVLRSNVELHIAAGATLLGSGDWRDYPERSEVKHVVSANLPRARNAALLFADECENIALTGQGVIDCNGTCFMREKPGDDWTGWKFERIGGWEQSPPRVVFLAGCRNVRVADVTMTNQPAGWSYWVHDCDRVTFDGVKILADVRYPNNDGIHVNSSRDVSISNCFIESGDDSIVVRANNRSLAENKVCERVVVANCTLRSCANAIRLGWVNDGTIRNCLFTNISIWDSVNGVGIILPGIEDWNKYDFGRERTRVENIQFTNIRMDGIYAHPVKVRIADGPTSLVDRVCDVSFVNVRATGLEFPLFRGRQDAPIKRFSFDGCSFRKVGEAALPDAHRHGAYWERVKDGQSAHTNGFSFVNTVFQNEAR